MTYVLTAILVAVGLLLVVVVAVQVLGALKRFKAASTRASAGVGDATGLLRARSAALRLAIKQRRTVGADDDRSQVPSTQYGQTGGGRG